MEDRSMEDRAEAARRALIDAALAAYEDAGLSGLCAEGRWEAAVDALRSLDLTYVARPRVDQPLSSPAPPTADLIAGVSTAIAAVSGNSTPPPGGGSVAASVGALAAALTRMVAGLTQGRPRYAHVADEMRMVADRASTLAGELTGLVARDASVFDALTAAYRQPRATPDAASARAAAIERALLPAAEAPLEIARAAASVAELAASVAERGNANAVADAAVAAFAAESACRAAALTVRVNVAGLRDRARAAALHETATSFAEAAARAATRAMRAATAPEIVGTTVDAGGTNA